MAKPQSGRFERNDRPVTCAHCGGDEFWLREGLLCTRTTSFFSVEGLNPSADCYICTECRHIEWFLRENEKA